MDLSFESQDIIIQFAYSIVGIKLLQLEHTLQILKKFNEQI